MGLRPLRRKGLRCAPMNAFRLRLHAPLPPFTPDFFAFFLGKANMLSLSAENAVLGGDNRGLEDDGVAQAFQAAHQPPFHPCPLAFVEVVGP